MEGFAILCVTIPPRGQVGPARPSLLVLLDFIHFYINSTNMKDLKNMPKSISRVNQELDNLDRDISGLN